MVLNKTIEQWGELTAKATATEIVQQPSTWEKTYKQVADNKETIKKFIEKVTLEKDYDIILTGAGTSEFVGNAVFSYLNTKMNYKCKSYATTDIVACPENYLSSTKPTLLVSFGRSGNSPESVAAVEVANIRCDNIYHLFITCNSDGALSKFAIGKDNCYAINLAPETHDQGFAMTSSFSNMYLATILVFTLNEIERNKEFVQTIIQGATELLTSGFEKIEHIVKDFPFDCAVYLGSNTNKGISQESSLKLLELTRGKVNILFDTPLGFRHGPKSIVGDETITIVYLSDDTYTRKYELDIIKEMSVERTTNKIFAVSSHADSEAEALVDYFYSFENESKLNNVFLGLEYIVIAQLISLYKSIALGFTPDNPCPSGVVNRVVKGVTIYPYKR